MDEMRESRARGGGEGKEAQTTKGGLEVGVRGGARWVSCNGLRKEKKTPNIPPYFRPTLLGAGNKQRQVRRQGGGKIGISSISLPPFPPAPSPHAGVLGLIIPSPPNLF